MVGTLDRFDTNPIEFYWIGLPGQYVVRATCIVNEYEATGAVTTDIKHPKVSGFGFTPPRAAIVVDQSYGYFPGTWLHFGKMGLEGMNWEATVTTGSNGRGVIAFLQLIRVDRRHSSSSSSLPQQKSTGSSYCLDGRFTYDEVSPPNGKRNIGNSDRQAIRSDDSPAK